MTPSRRANVYIVLMIAAGAAVLGHSVWNWHSQDWLRYVFYCTVALIASGMKVTLPSVSGTMSMSFLFVLIGIADLSEAEAMAMGCLCTLVQCVFHAKSRPRPVRVLFSVSSVACSIAFSYRLFHLRLASLPLETPLLLLLAALAYFVTNTLSVALVISLTEGKNVWRVWRECYFWSFPNYLVGAAVGWTLSAASHTFGWQASLLLLPVLYVIYRSHQLYMNRLEEDKRRAEQQRNHAEEISSMHRRTIQALALAIEAKDQTTGDHLARVEVYALGVGRELGLGEMELEALRASAMLHDIGKLAVPEYIISKPGKLTPEEFQKMKIHPVVGAEILEHVRFPYPVAPIVRSHHEKWNGTGYPDGLAGEQIPIGARILSAVDCLDALASDRQYRRALPLGEAIQVVQSEAGKSFDPRVVEVLARRYIELERQAKAVGQVEMAKLSTDVKIERGAAPAAGFEKAQSSAPSRQVNCAATEDRDARLLTELTGALERSETREEAFSVLRTRLKTLVPYDVMAVYLTREDCLEPECLCGDEYSLFASLKIPLGMGLSGWVAENGKSIINGNPSVEPGYLNDPTKFSTLRSALSVPLEAHDRVIGVLSLYRQEREAFSTQELKRVSAIAARLAGVLESHPAPVLFHGERPASITVAHAS